MRTTIIIFIASIIGFYAFPNIFLPLSYKMANIEMTGDVLADADEGGVGVQPILDATDGLVCAIAVTLFYIGRTGQLVCLIPTAIIIIMIFLGQVGAPKDSGDRVATQRDIESLRKEIRRKR